MTFEDPVGLIILVVGLAILLFLLSSIVHIIREYERLVVFFFGRLQGARGPGLVFLIPFVQQAVKVDLRERYLEVPQQTCITKDNAPISIDFLVYSKVFDPVETVTAVVDFTGASQALAATTLRAVIGDIPLDDVLAKREEINNVLRSKLDEVTHRWGVKITNVEIREIVPPRDIQEAMNRQMSAERNRRANITESEGTRQATINVAEGDKQSAILRAEGERQAQVLRAEGFSNALKTIFGAARGHRRQDDGAAVPRGAQGARRRRLHQVDRADGARRADAADLERHARRAPGDRGWRWRFAARAVSQPRGVLTLLGRVLGAITGGYLGYVALRGSRLLVQPTVRPFVPDVEGGPSTPGDLGLDYEDVRFTTDDGVTLGGWLVPAARETRAAVILMHGFSGHRLPELAFFVPWLQRALSRPAVRLPRPRHERRVDDHPRHPRARRRRRRGALRRVARPWPDCADGDQHGRLGGDHGGARPAGRRRGGRCRVRGAAPPDRQPPPGERLSAGEDRLLGDRGGGLAARAPPPPFADRARRADRPPRSAADCPT